MNARLVLLIVAALCCHAAHGQLKETKIMRQLPLPGVSRMTLFITWNATNMTGLTLAEALPPRLGEYAAPPPAAIPNYQTGGISLWWELVTGVKGTMAANCSYSSPDSSYPVYLGYEGSTDGYALGASYDGSWQADIFEALTNQHIIYNIYFYTPQ